MSAKYRNESNVDRQRKQSRASRLRRERLCKAMFFMAAVSAAFCLVCVCALSYRSIRTSASSGFKYYTSVTVNSGDTLWELAEEYIDYNYYKNRSSYIAEVKSINHLDDSCSLKAGQILILPYYSGEYVK